MKQKIKIIVLFVFVCGSAFVFTRGGQMQTNQTMKAQTKTAAEVYKNIQVLKDTPADQMIPMMDIMSASLGVKCSFCHVSDQWEKDDKEEKQIARKMVTMTLNLNKQNFNGRLEVSCATCHNGRPHPATPISLGENLFKRPNSQPSKEPMPTVDQILDKYTLGLGGRDALGKVKTRTIKASRAVNDGQPVTEEVYAKSPNKILVVTNFPQAAVSTGYNGADKWTIGGKGEDLVHEDELEQFKRDAQFLFEPLKLKEIYKEMTVAGADKINDKEVYAVRATTQAGKRERLFFDKQTGLLVRRYAAAPTAIGVFAFQVDYEDYRAVEGVKIPYLIKWSVPGRSWTRKVTEVKQNAAIDDAKFSEPKK
jgi:hypothetical protein